MSLAVVDGEEESITSKCTIDPYVAQEMGRMEYHADNVDWSKANWDRVPALRNLANLSDLSRKDLELPAPNKMSSLMAGGPVTLDTGDKEAPEKTVPEESTQDEENKQPDESTPVKEDPPQDGGQQVDFGDASMVPVAHDAAKKLADLSPEAQRVKRAEYVRVNRAMDLTEADTPSDMVVKQRVSEALSPTLLGMTHLLGLSDVTTQNDEQFMDLARAIADSNSADKSIVPLMMKSGVKLASTSWGALSAEKAGARRRDHNRGFHDSDIVAYDHLDRWADQSPSMHSGGGETWQQRVMETGVSHEDGEVLDGYRDALTSAEGRLRAVEERLAAITNEGSPYRDRVLKPTSPSPTKEIEAPKQAEEEAGKPVLDVPPLGDNSDQPTFTFSRTEPSADGRNECSEASTSVSVGDPVLVQRRSMCVDDDM